MCISVYMHAHVHVDVYLYIYIYMLRNMFCLLASTWGLTNICNYIFRDSDTIFVIHMQDIHTHMLPICMYIHIYRQKHSDISNQINNCNSKDNFLISILWSPHNFLFSIALWNLHKLQRGYYNSHQDFVASYKLVCKIISVIKRIVNCADDNWRKCGFLARRGTWYK